VYLWKYRLLASETEATGDLGAALESRAGPLVLWGGVRWTVAFAALQSGAKRGRKLEAG
jgi:hypothetical protein